MTAYDILSYINYKVIQSNCFIDFRVQESKFVVSNSKYVKTVLQYVTASFNNC